MTKNQNFCEISELVQKIVGGGTPERNNSDYWNGGIPWATVKDFKDGKHNLALTEEEISLTGLKYSAANLIPPLVPIICTRMAVGRVAVANFIVAINQDLKAIYPNEKVDSEYLVWLIESIRSELEALSTGSTVKGIRLAELLSLKVFCPNKQEQTQIATILSTIDRAIEQTEALIAKQQRIKTGLMQDLLTKGIDENGNIRSEETHEFKDSPLGRIPVEWEVSAGYNYFTLHSGINVNGIQRESDNHILYLKVEDFNNPENRDGIVITENTFNCPDHLISQLLEPGTIVFPKRGAAIFLNRVSYLRKRATLDPNIMGLRTKSGISSEFLHLVLLYKNLGTICDNSGIPQINNKHLYPLIVAVPAIDEQERIVVNFRQIQKLLHDICVQLAKLRSLKTGLMQDLLTGKVRVTDLLNQKIAAN
ncbi:putative type-1 restriction enzyme specificity protein MG438 [Microcystis aeruginosa NIES-2522]|uniref:restriction endonuclease subunit S n=1 Tax=Microcystis aeruginosa TaxID=1126 RepID=UPI0012317410|nr:restriction endonuclease subunit S [Microcystis aeruginosa]GCA85147.1 putative type-1 restriction enzyme specificity protein MG438 [Microcystis aeruginosa NIES-2522]